MTRTGLKRHANFVILPLLAAMMAAAGQAQESAGRRYLDEGQALAAAGDTAAAIERFEQAIKEDDDLLEAHLELGRIYTEMASWNETEFKLRKRAEKVLNRALELDSKNPYVLAALGYLRVKQHMKLDGGRILSQALKRAEQWGVQDPELLAQIHYYIGYVNEREYERMRDRYFVPPLRGPISASAGNLGSIWVNRGVDEYLRSTAPIDAMGSSHRAEMIAHYQATLRYDISHFEAHRRLMLQLYDQGRLDEYLLLARNLVETNPGRPEARLYLGLGLHAAGREDEAGRAFGAALAALPEAERWKFRNLEPTLRKKSGEIYMQLDDESRAQFEESFWRVTDPLFITAANERRLEHLGRVAYADLRFYEPATGLRGWESDRGVIYIRYGAPLTLFRQGKRIVWRYAEGGPTFMFDQTPGYNHTRFAGDYRFIAQDYRFVEPANYDRIPSIPELLDIPVQLVRFRGASTRELVVEVHAELPLVRLARSADLSQGEIEGGFFVVNAVGQKVVSQTFSEIIDYEDVEDYDNIRSWRLILPGGGLLVAAVEARETSSWVAAASRDTFTAALFHKDGDPKLSDLLLGDFIRELKPQPRRRSDYDIIANPAREYGSGEAVHLYYEIYDLETDGQGFASFDVLLEVRIKELHREGVLSQILGGLADAWGFTVEGDDQLGLRFSREVDMNGRDRVNDYIKLELKGAPAGDYEIRVRIWDKIAEKMADRSRKFVVISDE